MPKKIDVIELKTKLHLGGSIALLDVREAGECGEGRPLLAVNAPYSILETTVCELVPSLKCPIVTLADGPNDDRAERAAARLSACGYTDVAVLVGGLQAWANAGYGVFKGVNVPSKTFGELLEHEFDTPAIDASELEHMRHATNPPLILDGRTPAEFDRMSIPDGISCPNGELALRAATMAAPEQTIVVNCAGRTRSIVGAQTLIDFGIPNKVVALRNGTIGWTLSGYELAHQSEARFPMSLPPDQKSAAQARASELAEQDGIACVSAVEVDAWLDADEECVFLLDVRTHEEYNAGHQNNVVHAPGGQLVQATDHWIAARGARVVLIDDEQVRAVMAARWLKCMGHNVFVLGANQTLAPRDKFSVAASLPTLDELSPSTLAASVASASVSIVDLRSSAEFGRVHLQGASWGIRPRLSQLELKHEVLLVAERSDVAAAAAIDLQAAGHRVVGWTVGVPQQWRAAGFAVTEDAPLGDAQRIDYLFFVHDRHHGNAVAAQAYLDWEIGLIAQLDVDERALFRLGLPH